MLRCWTSEMVRISCVLGLWWSQVPAHLVDGQGLIGACSRRPVWRGRFSHWGSALPLALLTFTKIIASVQFSHSVRSNSLRPHGLQYFRPPCPSPTPRVYSNLCPLSRWCYPSISSSVVPFSSHLQSFPASGSFQMSQFMRWPKYWNFSFSISPSNEYSGLISFRMAWLDLLAVQGTLKSLLQHHSSKASILWCSALSIVQLSHPYMTTGKTIALTRRNFVGKVMSQLFNMLSSLVITFLLRVSIF